VKGTTAPGPRPAASRRRTIAIWALRVLQVALVVWPIFYWDGGVIDNEATAFVEAYLDERGFLSQIFDPRRTDFGNYQARELSYVADWVDAHVVVRLLRRDLVVLAPFSALIGGLALVIVFPRAAARAFPALSPVTAGLWLLVFLSHFVWLSSAGLFYRSGKILLLPILLALAARVIAAAREGEPPAVGARLRLAGTVGGLGLVAALLDRQGFFELALALALVLVACALGRRLWATLAALATAVGVAVAYNLVLAPAAIQALNGYRPDFAYQSLDLGEFFSSPARFGQAAEVAGSYVRLLLGGLPPLVLVAGVVVLVVVWLVRPGPRPPRLEALGMGGAVLAAQWLMLALMIHRHEPMYTLPDHRLCYYPIVLTVLLTFALAGLSGWAGGLWGTRARRGVQAALVVLVVANVAAWPGHRKRMEPWFPGQVEQSERLKSSLRSGAKDPGLNQYHGRLYDVLQRHRGD
jgi:hypothetical protein